MVRGRYFRRAGPGYGGARVNPAIPRTGLFEYRPGAIDLADPAVIRGRPIRPGSIVRVTRWRVDPLGKIVWIADDEGNEQAVYRKALVPAKG